MIISPYGLLAIVDYPYLPRASFPEVSDPLSKAGYDTCFPESAEIPQIEDPQDFM